MAPISPNDIRQGFQFIRDELVRLDAQQAVRHTEILGKLEEMALAAQADRDQQGIRIAKTERDFRERLQRLERAHQNKTSL